MTKIDVWVESGSKNGANAGFQRESALAPFFVSVFSIPDRYLV